MITITKIQNSILELYNKIYQQSQQQDKLTIEDISDYFKVKRARNSTLRFYNKLDIQFAKQNRFGEGRDRLLDTITAFDVEIDSGNIYKLNTLFVYNIYKPITSPNEKTLLGNIINNCNDTRI